MKVPPVLLLLAALAVAGPQTPAPLDGTVPLDWTGDLSVRMMDGLHRYVERKIAESPRGRSRFWHRDLASAARYERSVAANRERLARILGLRDPRVPVVLERVGDDRAPALLAEAEGYRVYRARWSVLAGVHGEGLLLEPRARPRGGIVALADADQTPEQLAGLAPGVPAESQFARRLAEAGFEVVIPALVDRADTWSGNAEVAWTNQPHREWIYRQAYHMGRHVIGYEVAKVHAAVDWFRSRMQGPVGVAGYGEGGLVAFYAAATDPRIAAALVSGYFDDQARPWEEPLYRNLFGLLREFGAAEVATLIAPRGLVVEYSPVPRVEGPPEPRQGRRGAAAGRLATADFRTVEAEFRRIDTLLGAGISGAAPRHLVAGPGGKPVGPGSTAALERLAHLLGAGASSFGAAGARAPAVGPPGLDPAERQQRQVRELEEHVQRLIADRDATRDRLFGERLRETPSMERFQELQRAHRRLLREEILGDFEDERLAPAPRTRVIYERPRWVGHEVVLDVFPDVFAWGVLLVPRDLRPGERRPVVVCQHGRNGVPADTIEGDNPFYHDFAARLAERGFVVFAPHNPYRGEDRYRFLSRKANSVRATLFSFILAQHGQILQFLEGLPFVDPERIAFYGLSYGGETAVRIPPLLDRYCLSICSADFNDWARKVSSTAARYSFMFTIEWEMPYFDLGSATSYAEMAALMIPRPFMVERGHRDGVAPDEWVAAEFAKVRRLYDQLGLGDRTEIEFFDGPHTIHGVGTFRFLEEHLRWSVKR